MISIPKKERKNPKYNFHIGAKQLIAKRPHEVFLAKIKIPDKLIIFIHGFNGKAIETWNSFPTLMCCDPAFSTSDIIFYGYDSLKYQASDHAGIFCDFIDQELIANNGNLSKLVIESKLNERKYTNIHIVAHSLGAIVTREALIRAKNKGHKWIKQTRISLFAPAHLGAKIDALIFDSLNLFLITKLVSITAKFSIPVLSDLKQGSVILQKIKDDTEKFVKSDEGNFLKALFVAHAPGDKVVLNGRFVEDNESELFEGKSHTTICKPNIKYLTPLEKFAEAINK